MVLLKQFKTLKYFSQKNLVPLLLNLNENKFPTSDFPKEDFFDDLNIYTEKELNEFYETCAKKFDFITEGYSKKQKVIELKKWKINEDMIQQIAKERINALINTDKPYNHDDFNGIEINDGLININQLKIGLNNFILNDNKYQLCLPINESNSNYWISNTIIKLSKNKNITFQIRLDPLIKNAENSMQLMDIYGIKLNWEDLSKINGEISILKESEGVKTEIIWMKKENKLHFKCEELPLYESIHERGSRYFHAIYDIDKKLFSHCDGSIKIYEDEEFLSRNSIHLKNKNAKDLGRYFKIFRCDGEISTDNFTSLITSYFLRNEDISNYLKELNDT